MLAPMRALVLVLLMAACGGSSSNTPATEEPAADEPEEDPKVTAARQRMRERQAEVCEDMCDRLTECARDDALKNNPDALADKEGVTGEQVLAKNKANCNDDCNGPGSGLMTVDQRKRLVECFPLESCGEFTDCTNTALSTP